MLNRILGHAAIISSAVILAACSSNLTQYEQQVQNLEAVYCYKSIGTVQCYTKPLLGESRRLVNFYGPAPSQYDKPDQPRVASPKAPRMIDHWVKDPEPIPQAAPLKSQTRYAPPIKAEPVRATNQQEISSAAPTRQEDVSFMDGLMRSMFGKPQLAYKPLASMSPPLQPAPPAQPLIAVEIGTI